MEQPFKKQKQQKVLLGLVELYLKTGKPIGSNTLKEHGFAAISSATIRNYFANLEKQGYLMQHHTSGGRVPTDLAFKLFAHANEEAKNITAQDDLFFESLLNVETKEVANYLQQAIEALCEASGCAAFLTSPIFDQDFIIDIRLVNLDHSRILCIILTDFGLVHTETIFTPKKLSSHSIKRIEEYFRCRLTKSTYTELSEEEKTFADRIYNELLLRHIVASTRNDRQPIYKGGLSKLLLFPEFQEVSNLSKGLSVFENPHLIESILKETAKSQKLKFWIGRDLSSYIGEGVNCSMITIPYKIHQKTVGAIAILGPLRIDYPKLFGILRSFSNYLSNSLTKSIFTFKIPYRSHEKSSSSMMKTSHLLIENQENRGDIIHE